MVSGLGMAGGKRSPEFGRWVVGKSGQEGEVTGFAQEGPLRWRLDPPLKEVSTSLLTFGSQWPHILLSHQPAPEAASPLWPGTWLAGGVWLVSLDPAPNQMQSLPDLGPPLTAQRNGCVCVSGANCSLFANILEKCFLWRLLLAGLRWWQWPLGNTPCVLDDVLKQLHGPHDVLVLCGEGMRGRVGEVPTFGRLEQSLRRDPEFIPQGLLFVSLGYGVLVRRSLSLAPWPTCNPSGIG